MVQPDGLGWTAGYRWDEVRGLCVRGDPKPAPQPTVCPPSLPPAVIDVTGEEEEAAICGRPGCTFAWDHDGACSNETNLGKRVRTPRVLHDGMQPLEESDSPKQVGSSWPHGELERRAA